MRLVRGNARGGARREVVDPELFGRADAQLIDRAAGRRSASEGRLVAASDNLHRRIGVDVEQQQARGVLSNRGKARRRDHDCERRVGLLARRVHSADHDLIGPHRVEVVGVFDRGHPARRRAKGDCTPTGDDRERQRRVRLFAIGDVALQIKRERRATRDRLGWDGSETRSGVVAAAAGARGERDGEASEARCRWTKAVDHMGSRRMRFLALA